MRIGKANAVLRKLYCSVLKKQKLPKTAKLSVLTLVFVPSSHVVTNLR